MGEKQEFANLQVFCDKERRVAKRVYEYLYKGYKTFNTNVLYHQFDCISNILGCTESSNADASRSIETLFNAVASPPYFLRKYDDGWTSILHNRFCVTNIVSYALQYSQNVREHLVVALAYNNEQFLCAAFKDGEIIFSYNPHRESKVYTMPDAGEIARFAETIGCTRDDVMKMINATYHEKVAAAACIFKHPIIAGANKIKSAERSLYVEVSGKGLWY